MVLSFSGCQKPAAPAAGMDVAPATEAPAVVETSVVAQAAIDYFHNMPEHDYKIAQKEFVEKVAAGEPMFILDIRSAEDYGKGHVKGAVNAPWGPAIAENLNKIPQDQEVFIYCYTGQTAGQAVMTLNAAGINARSVSFGFKTGIAKVAGSEAIIDTTANAFGTETYPVDEAVQTAVTEYYAGLAGAKDTPFANYKVSEEQLWNMMTAKEDFYLLSIRSAKDHAVNSIEGSVNVPFDNNLVDQLADVPKDKKVVVYCYSGQTSGQTVAAMRMMGYDAVSLNGGLGMPANVAMGWMNNGYPIVSENPAINGAYQYFANMPDNTYKIDNKEFVEKLKAGEELYVVDIRSAEDYAKGHAKGAINLPWGPEMGDQFKMIPQDKEVLIYCYTGQTAGQAVMTMNLAGINARSVHLGWNMGISKVEGFEAVTEMDAHTFGTETYTIEAEIQDAIHLYYAGLADVKGTTFANYKISEDDLKAMMDAGDDFYLLSVRKAEDYAKGHIKGAVNVPFGKDMLNGVGKVPKTKKVVVYCYTGQTAGQAVAAMRLIGIDAVSLNGGVGTPANVPMGWTNKGYELVTE
jgi:rhodanese-related sulfurtransferase